MQLSTSSSNSAGSLAKSSKPTITTSQSQISTQTPLLIGNDTWYQKMRQIFLIEYTKYFEGRGFLRLKDELKETTNSKTVSTENQTNHFIKWIQQDGFIYITVNLDEIFVNIKLGYCTRYRMASRSFLVDLIKFFAQDFHVHSLTYDLHLLAINRNLTSPAWTSPKQMSLTISKFLDEFVEFFSRVPLFSSNKVFKNIYERTDHSLLPHKFGLIFDYMIFAKKKLNKNGQFNSCSFTPLDLNLDNNIGIYTLSENQKPDSYSKYLVIKIESFTTSTPPVSQSMVTSQYSVLSSAVKKPSSKTENLHSTKLTTTISKQTYPPTPQQQPPSKLSSSSSSSSLINQRALSSENSFTNLTQTQQSQILRQNPTQQPSVSSMQQSSSKTPSTLAKSNQMKHEAHIRLVCYYLCINKQSTSFAAHRNPTTNLFDQDLLFIDKIVEEAINVYKLETFWDNLMMSMSSITDFLNENSAGSSAHPLSAPITFSIESDELEQILNHSQKVDALELDPSLFSFLQECYSIKDKIHTSFEFSFGRHFIFTQSESVEYCLLLINDNLIKKFRCSVSSSIQHQSNQPPINLASFVLSDRILQSSASSPSSLSSSHSSTTKVSSSAATSSSASSSTLDANTDKQLNSFVLLKFDKIYKMTYLWQINRIVQQELNDSVLSNTSASVNATAAAQASFSAIKNNNNKISSNKYLSFTINNLIYVLWEDLFTN